MGCLKINEDKYEGVVIEMGNNNKNNNGRKYSKNQNQSKNNNSSVNFSDQSMQLLTENMKKISETLEKFSDKAGTKNGIAKSTVIQIIIQIVGIVITLLGVVWGLGQMTKGLDDDIKLLNTEMVTINSNMSSLYYDMYHKDGSINELEEQVSEINNILDISAIDTTTNIAPSIDVEPNKNNAVTSLFDETTCIGKDSSGKEYYADKYTNTTILLTYIDGDKEVYFLGQYNDDYKWDGYCVTNAYYLDGTLYGICESNFENGQRKDYKSFYKDASNEWIYTNRVCNDDGNLGTSISYALEYNKVKNFTNTNVRVTDVLYVDKFIETVNPTMIKYYYGNTSGGVYNDDSGQAYYVEYFADGTVKTLYQGNFIDGQFTDYTDNAWYIAKDVNTEYMYYKGFFKENKTLNNDGYIFENPIDLARINEIIQDKSFECELRWATE